MHKKKISGELKRQVKYLSKKLNVQKIRSALRKLMPKKKLLSKSVGI